MDIEELYRDYNVDFKTEGHKHCRPGWINAPCPHCTGNTGYHLGFEIINNRFTCWRCGWHPIIPTIALLINLPERETREIVKKYGGYYPKLRQATTPKNGILEYRLPSLVRPLQSMHIKYLEGRGFDPEYLQKYYYILGTGHTSLLKDESSGNSLNYKFRIIIPFIWDNNEVSFDSRDITNRHPYKYMACPIERERIPHKHILYGRQDKWIDRVIAVEGPTDAWRFGYHAAATSGIKFTPWQVRELAKFKRVPVCYDDDPQAIQQAKILVQELQLRGVDSFRVPIVGDPGGMKQSEADYLVKQLLK